MEKDFGVCGKCGEFIRAFKWALPDWLCKRCYDERFPERRKQEEKERDRAINNLFNSHIPSEESYEFLNKNLYTQPQLYEKSFEQVKPYANALQSFQTLEQMRDFCAGQSREYRLRLRTELTALAHLQKGQKLFPRVIEVMLFVTWVDLVEEYGTEECFNDGYNYLIQEAAGAL